MIYLDNAATSFPKPPEVLEEMLETYSRLGVLPGKQSYGPAAACDRYLEEARSQIAAFFGSRNPEKVLFAYNSTAALKAIIHGLAEPGSHVISTRLEHNSVLSPLLRLRDRGVITLDTVSFDTNGFIDPQEVADLIGPSTRLVVLNHVSNVLGTIQPVCEIGRICGENGVPLVLDAAQSAGLVPIDMPAMNIQAVAFTGHKSLLGPTGIGGLVLGEAMDLRAINLGRPGADAPNTRYPVGFPYCVEPGTPNLLGIFGLCAAMRHVEHKGIGNLHGRVTSLARALRDGLASLEAVKLYCAQNLDNHTGIISCNLEGVDPGDFCVLLDSDFGIAARSGLNCAPLVHEDLGTSPRGAVRFSFGAFNTEEQVTAVLAAVRAIASR